MQVPEWMRERRRPDADATAPGCSRSRSLLRQSAAGFARVLAELLDNETIAARDGLLQHIDERAKVLGLLGLVVVATMVHRPTTLLAAWLAAVVLAALSRVPLRRLAGAWLMVPLFSMAIVAPALLNVVCPGKPLLVLGHLPSGAALAVTDTGLLVAARFVLRTAVCVTLVLLLSATTRADRLFRGLRALGVPVIFVMLLSMMERYLTLFLRAAEELHLARLSRTVRVGPLRDEQQWAAGGIAALLRRTHELSHGVYRAMLSRGYRGEPRLLDERR
ncbi:MAG: cobalt ECF transporter T component CbiQ [Armatimonadetes bacterium]|nr:cobalt ECF transporter T component CbiQ [Armatimonadota bacterium]